MTMTEKIEFHIVIVRAVSHSCNVFLVTCENREDTCKQDRTHCFSYFVDCGKRGEEKMKRGRTEMSQGGPSVTERKASSSYFPANVYAKDINMCKAFFLPKILSW